MMSRTSNKINNKVIKKASVTKSRASVQKLKSTQSKDNRLLHLIILLSVRETMIIGGLTLSWEQLNQEAFMVLLDRIWVLLIIWMGKDMERMVKLVGTLPHHYQWSWEVTLGGMSLKAENLKL